MLPPAIDQYHRVISGITPGGSGSTREFGASADRLYGSIMTKNFKSRIISGVHETVKGLYGAGVISKRRMHEYDALYDLEVPTLGADQIKMIPD